VAGMDRGLRFVIKIDGKVTGGGHPWPGIAQSPISARYIRCRSMLFVASPNFANFHAS
jgi:hypothetical protein